MSLGDQVRVPLSGRRVRGWVVEVAQREPDRLKELLGVSGEAPVFDNGLLRSLQWAATHYVAPLAVVLAKATPPNLPGAPAPLPASSLRIPETRHPIGTLAALSARGTRRPAVAVVGSWRGLEWIAPLASVLSAPKSVMIVTATASEVSEIAARARAAFGQRVVEVPTEGDRELTEAWTASQRAGVLVVGPPRIAAWHVADLALAVVLEEGRRAMKDRQTPTIHVRELVRNRSRVEGINAAFFGPTPSVEILSAGAAVERSARRAWGSVELIDRSAEAPGGGLLSDRVVAALRTLSRAGSARAFLLTSRRMIEAVVEEGNRKLGAGAFGGHPEGVVGSVGSERDLAGLSPVRVAVAVSIDLMPGAAGYRGEEESLRQLGRLANSVDAGGRLMAQTTQPDSPLATTLRKGDPIPYLEHVLAERARQGMPPAREMIAVEIRGGEAGAVGERLAALTGIDVFGPVPTEEGTRWLLAGRLERARPELREMAASWREKGSAVRIDADPIDL